MLKETIYLLDFDIETLGREVFNDCENHLKQVHFARPKLGGAKTVRMSNNGRKGERYMSSLFQSRPIY
jgi:hypothetical protein